MKNYLKYIYGFCLILIPIFIYVIWYAGCPTTIYLVRHAEKLDSSSNTNLAGDGLLRADALSLALENADISAIYTSDFCRTAQTAQALANELELPLQVAPINGNANQLNNCNPAIIPILNVLDASISTSVKLIENVLARFSKKNILIVGHSNTVPELVAALGAPELCPSHFPLRQDGSCHFPSNDFNNIIIVEKDRNGHASLTVLKYGE